MNEKAFYEENGFAIFDNVMSEADCDAVLAIYERHADDDYATILNLDREVPDIRERVMKHPRVVELVEMLIGPAVGCQTFFLFKKPGTRYAAQSFVPHQDNSYPQAAPGAYLAVDIALADQDADSGGIFLYPGSHKLGLLPFEPMTGYREQSGERPGNSCGAPNGFVHIDVVLKKGQALIFDGNLVHGSYPNNGNAWRPAIITNYIKSGADMISGRTANRLRIPLK